jgi:hypothetical protein
VGAYLAQTRALGNALLFSVPLLVFYHVGLLLTGSGVLNGADFLTGFLFARLGFAGYLALQSLLLLVAAVVAAVLRRRRALDLRHFPVLLAESALYAFVMGTVILFVMREAHLLGPQGAPGGAFEAAVLSAGAGFHEELVFRLALLSGLWYLLQVAFNLPRWGAATLAVVLTSVTFSLAHYLGAEPFQWYTFWYRTLAGVFFSVAFVARGFAVAAWTHALYDVYVMVF